MLTLHSVLLAKSWTEEFIGVLGSACVRWIYQLRQGCFPPSITRLCGRSERLRAVWTPAQKLATYHTWMALPLKPSNVRGPPHVLPRYLELEL